MALPLDWKSFKMIHYMILVYHEPSILCPHGVLNILVLLYSSLI